MHPVQAFVAAPSLGISSPHCVHSCHVRLPLIVCMQGRALTYRNVQHMLMCREHFVEGTSTSPLQWLTGAALLDRYIQSTCATSGEGLYEGLDWLSSNIANKA